MKITCGTCYFVSKRAAVRYYRDYIIDTRGVDQKIAADEIRIGKPTIKAGETLHIIDNGTRYAIEGEEREIIL